jgi:sporulation protein YlmC with PRC-barrel domain
MMALPAHQRLPEDDTDEELSDDQIQELLKEAERSLRAKQTFNNEALHVGPVADVSLKTEGSVTRMDQSKLIDQKHRTLAEGVKKIEDPILVKKKKQLEVRTLTQFANALSMMTIFLLFFLKQTRTPSWASSCIIDGLLDHSYTEATVQFIVTTMQ